MRSDKRCDCGTSSSHRLRVAVNFALTVCFLSIPLTGKTAPMVGPAAAIVLLHPSNFFVDLTTLTETGREGSYRFLLGMKPGNAAHISSIWVDTTFNCADRTHDDHTVFTIFSSGKRSREDGDGVKPIRQGTNFAKALAAVCGFRPHTASLLSRKEAILNMPPAKQFTALLNANNDGNHNGPRNGEGRAKPQVIRLNCSLTSPGGQHMDFIATIDFSRGAVIAQSATHPASITDGYVQWPLQDLSPTTKFSLNRYTGQIFLLDDGDRVGTGTCNEVKSKKF